MTEKFKRYIKLKHKNLKHSIIAILLLLDMLISSSTVAASVSAETEAVYVPIIMYHEVKTFKNGKDVISPWEFESDLKYLSENDYTAITMGELIDYVYNGASLPDKPIILSFDDGYLSNYVYVYPLLKKYNTKIVFSILGKNTDDFTSIPDNNIDYSHVTWNQLNEMLDSGLVEVQNHSYNLHRITKSRTGCDQAKSESFAEYEKLLSEDVGKLQKEITLLTGQTPTTFVYPYGAWSDNTNIILKNLGFKATLTCTYGVNVITNNPDSLFCLKRICRAHNAGLSRLMKEAWKTIR